MRVVFATAEVSPIARTGGLGDVCGSLPRALASLGHEVIIFMPFYRQAREWCAQNGGTEVLFEVPIQWADWTVEATFLQTTLPDSEIPVIMVANDFFFNREHIYSPRLDGVDDGPERFLFFCRAFIRGCELLGIAPDIVHAHDWHTALLPIYLHSGLRGSEVFSGTRSIYTIHNLNYQGIATPDRFVHFGLHSHYWAPDALEHFGSMNLMKGGIIFADQVTTVSPIYAREVCTPAFGAGLDGVLRELRFKFSGVLNGIDTESWNPATDKTLDTNFEVGRLAGKSVAKRALCKEAGFPFKPKTPLIGVVSRLVEQKGFQLLIPVLDKLLRAGAQMVVLGNGDPALEIAFLEIAWQYPEHCRVWVGFDEPLSRRIYAGSDLMLMPSLYEPCGLNQLYALRYGAVPVVRLTGGLADTVVPFDGTNSDVANGFGFITPDSEELYSATWIGMLNFKDGYLWKTLQANGMSADHSWDRSAREYEQIYDRALE